jgi:hypothetical protein
MQDTMLEDTGASTNALARVTQLTTLTFGTELTDAHLQVPRWRRRKSAT